MTLVHSSFILLRTRRQGALAAGDNSSWKAGRATRAQRLSIRRKNASNARSAGVAGLPALAEYAWGDASPYVRGRPRGISRVGRREGSCQLAAFRRVEAAAPRCGRRPPLAGAERQSLFATASRRSNSPRASRLQSERPTLVRATPASAGSAMLPVAVVEGKPLSVYRVVPCDVWNELTLFL